MGVGPPHPLRAFPYYAAVHGAAAAPPHQRHQAVIAAELLLVGETAHVAYRRDEQQGYVVADARDGQQHLLVIGCHMPEPQG